MALEEILLAIKIRRKRIMKYSLPALVLLTLIQGCDNPLRLGFKGFEFLAVRPDAKQYKDFSKPATSDLALPASYKKCGNLFRRWSCFSGLRTSLLFIR